MSLPTKTLLNAVVITTTGAWFPGGIFNKTIHIKGTFSGTVDIETSFDQVEVENVYSGTTEQSLELATNAPWIRAIFTRSSGSVTVNVAS